MGTKPKINNIGADSGIHHAMNSLAVQQRRRIECNALESARWIVYDGDPSGKIAAMPEKRKSGSKRPLVSKRPRFYSNRRLRPFFPLFLVAGIATYAYYAWPVDVTATQVFRGRAVEALPLRGTVEHEYATARAKVDGRVVEITVAEGDEVFEGEILARFARPEKIPEKIPKKIYVTAPMSGFVLGVNTEAGAQVAVGQPLFHIRTCCTRRVVVEVAEEKIVKLIVGQDAYVASDALPGEVFQGQLKAIIPRPSSPGQGYLLHIPMQLEASLEIGSRVNVDVIVRQEEEAILIPLDALTEGHVWVVEGKRAVRRRVEVGSLIDGRAHILSGLKDGDEIILNAPPELHAGRRIAVIRGPVTE